MKTKEIEIGKLNMVAITDDGKFKKVPLVDLFVCIVDLVYNKEVKKLYMEMKGEKK